MNKDEIIKFFVSEYDYYRKYAIKICGKIGRADKAEDIVHDVFLIISDEDFEKKIRNKVNTAAELRTYIKKILQRASTTDHSTLWGRYHPPFCSPDSSDINPEDIMVETNIDLADDQQKIYPSKLEVFWITFNQMHISEYNRKIYIFHCVKGKSFKEWQGPESLKKLNKVCYEINKTIRTKIKNNNYYLLLRGGFFHNSPL